MKLLIYNLDVNYLSDKYLYIADFLSRYYIKKSYNNKIDIEGIVHNIEFRNLNTQVIANVTVVIS